jgi:DNA-binding CsgD family transcriptional regulator
MEVLELLRLGLSNREIANRLGVSLAGAKFHVSEIISKLGVSSREEAANWRQRAPLLAPTLFLPRRLDWRHLVPIAAVSSALLILVAILAIGGRDSRNELAWTTVAATAVPTATPEGLQSSAEFLRPTSLSEAQALATFPILLPPDLPAGFELHEIVYFKHKYRCPPAIDTYQCVPTQNDFVQLTFMGADGEFMLAQGYGGGAFGNIAHLFAPLHYRGLVDVVTGRQARWVKGWPRPGFDPGGRQPLDESDWINDSTLMLTWLASRDKSPAGTDSPRCLSLISTSLNLEQLLVIARSIPVTPLEPGRIDC